MSLPSDHQSATTLSRPKVGDRALFLGESKTAKPTILLSHRTSNSFCLLPLSTQCNNWFPNAFDLWISSDSVLGFPVRQARQARGNAVTGTNIMRSKAERNLRYGNILFRIQRFLRCTSMGQLFLLVHHHKKTFEIQLGLALALTLRPNLDCVLRSSLAMSRFEPPAASLI